MGQEELDAMIDSISIPVVSAVKKRMKELVFCGGFSVDSVGGIPWGAIIRVAMEDVAMNYVSNANIDYRNLRRF